MAGVAMVLVVGCGSPPPPEIESYCRNYETLMNDLIADAENSSDADAFQARYMTAMHEIAAMQESAPTEQLSKATFRTLADNSFAEITGDNGGLATFTQALADLEAADVLVLTCGDLGVDIAFGD